VLRRRAPKRLTVSNIDRLVFAGLYHLAPEVLDAVKILKPETTSDAYGAAFIRRIRAMAIRDRKRICGEADRLDPT
jgi:hypothetical protein